MTDPMTSTSRKPRLFITASTPWAIRNYFQTGIVRALAADHDVIVFTTAALEQALIRDGHAAYIRTIRFEQCPEPRAWRISRQIRKKLYFETRSVETEAIWERYGGRPLLHRIGGRLIAAASRMLSGERMLRALSVLDARVNRSNVFAELFRESPDALLFATHTNGYFEDAILRSAWAHGIPAALMILSWDHLSTKVVLTPMFEHILLWTDLQKDEVLDTYPWIRPDQVHVTGIPHFDGYVAPTSTSREAWCAEYGLDPARRTLVYYSMPQVRHCHQHVIVEAMADAIAAGRELPPDLQILVKCHPFDDYSLYRPLAERYPHVAVQDTTLPPGADPMGWIPKREELQISRDILAHADVTVNIYSTVTVEAAYFDKPIVHVAFDPGSLPPGRIPCREYYNFTHFRPIVETGASALAYSQDELHAAIREALAHPERRREQRRALSAAWAGPMDGHSSDRVIATLRALTHGGRTSAPAASAVVERIA